MDVALASPLATGALGMVVGSVLALTGAGGGVLAVPLLVLALGWPLTQAAPTALLAVGLAAALGAFNGLRAGAVRWRAAIMMGGAGMLGAPLGVWLSHLLPSRPVLWAFAALMLWLGWRQWPRPEAPSSAPLELPPCVVNPQSGRLRWTSPCVRAIAGTGLLSGTLSGLIGVGGGFVIVPALRRHSDLDLRQIQLTSLAVIALVAVSGVGTAAAHGQLDWAAALPFVGGAMLAMLLGRRLAEGLSPALSQRLFALSCLIVAGLLIARA